MRGRIVDAGYARVSTQDQDLAIQLAALDAAGCWPIYEDKVSGVAKARPVRDELLAQLTGGDTLTVWKLDRLGRSVTEVLGIVKDLEARGVAFRSLTQPIDTSTPAGKAFLGLLAIFADFERETILERTAAGLARREAAGLPHGRPRMFGTVGAGPTAVPEAQAAAEAELVAEAAERVLAGEPMNRIVGDWNARGISSRDGKTWAVNALRRVLTNPQAEAIIGAEGFRSLAVIFDNRSNRRQTLGRPAERLLSGILACGREGCGQPMYGTWKRANNGGRELYYRCKPGNGSGGRFKGCGSTGVSMTRADAWAAEAFVAAVVSPAFAETLDRRRAELLADDLTAADLDDWRAELGELEQVMPTRFAPPDAKQRHAKLQRLVRDATARLMAQPDLQAMADLPRSEGALRAAWDAWSVAERRVWLRRVLERIEVKPATAQGRASVVEDRLAPVWKV